MRHLLEATLILLGTAASAWSAPAQIELGKIQLSKEDVIAVPSIQSEALRSFVVQAAEGRRIVGLGEVSHFTQECYELKGAMILALMGQGFDGLVLEVDFGQALLWDDFVVNGVGDLDALIARSGWFTYRTEEFKAVLRAIRAANVLRAERGEEAPFRVFGMEMTSLEDSLRWMARYIGGEADGAAGAQAPPVESPRARLAAALKEERPAVAFQAHTEEERMDYWALYYSVSSFLASSQDELVAEASGGGSAEGRAEHGAERYAIALRIAETMRQYATYVSQDDFTFQIEIRDQFSARNVLWCMNQLGDGSQVALWAHNGHVAKEAPNANYNVVGDHLHRWFGEDYYAFGFTFNEGECAAFSHKGFETVRFERSENESLTTRLGAFESPFLVLDVARLLANDPAHASFARRPVPIRIDVGESFSGDSPRYMEVQLAGTYDALVYIDKTHRASPIKWVR